MGAIAPTSMERLSNRRLTASSVPYCTPRSTATVTHDEQSVTACPTPVPVTVSLIDAEGNVLPTAKNHVTFRIEGGKILGTGNGDPNSHEDDTKPERDLFAGLAQVIVGRTLRAGTPLTLTASVDGLPDATITLDTCVAEGALPVIGYCSLRVLSGLTVSAITAERPDYVAPISENDMNTLSPITLGDELDSGFTVGWRFLRAKLPLKARGDVAECVLELPKTSAEELRIAVNGQEVYAAREVWGARSISFRVPAAEEYDLRILTAAWGEKPSGIAGAVKMLVM